MSGRPRLLVAGLWHETNTFSPVPTRFEDFRAYQYAEGEAARALYRGTNTEFGGFIAAAEAAGFDLCFALYAGALPSGTIEAAAFQRLMARTRDLVGEAGAVDGAVIALHGAMVVEGRRDAEADWVAMIRSLIGRDRPLVATFDLHANIGRALFDAADVLIGYDTYPHTDMADRGADAVRLLGRRLAGDPAPAKALRKLPLLTVPQMQGTDDHPARAIYGSLAQERRRPGIRAASVALGFPYSDRDDLGVAVVAYGDDQAAAEALAQDTAAGIWSLRDAFVPRLSGPAEAVAIAASASGTTILVEVAENVGGGAPGDGTMLLRPLLAADIAAAIVIWDPEAAAAACAAGAGATVSLTVGGRAGPFSGGPVAVTGEIAFAAPVIYRRQSSYMTGQQVDLGRVAVVRAGQVRVMLTERRAMPFDADHLRAAGIVPEGLRAIVVKSAIAWRAGFAAMADRAVFVDTPGICASNLAQFRYDRGGAALYPLNRAAQWPAAAVQAC